MRSAAAVCLVALSLTLASCGGGGGGPSGPPGADFSLFSVETLSVDGHAVAAWIADTPALQSQGLMNATPEQLAPLGDGTPRGMLFVFATDLMPSFWMRDTYVALDLAYIRSDGTIAEIHALAPLDETPVPAGEPVRMALEVPAGTLATLGVDVGDLVLRP